MTIIHDKPTVPVEMAARAGSPSERPVEPTPDGPPRRRIVTPGRVFIVFCLLLVGFHQQLLPCIYWGLVSQEDVATVDYVAIVNGDRESFATAAALLNQGEAGAVLVLERRPVRIVKLGISPALGSAARQELAARGCSDYSIKVLSTSATTSWQVVRELDQYLHTHAPEARMAVICPEIQSRYFRRIIDSCLEPPHADRLHVRAFSTGAFDAHNWWHNRLAIAKVGMAYLRLGYVICYGEGTFAADNWDPDRYEASVKRQPAPRS
jgi:hypothetical protein